MRFLKKLFGAKEKPQPVPVTQEKQVDAKAEAALPKNEVPVASAEVKPAAPAKPTETKISDKQKPAAASPAKPAVKKSAATAPKKPAEKAAAPKPTAPKTAAKTPAQKPAAKAPAAKTKKAPAAASKPATAKTAAPKAAKPKPEAAEKTPAKSAAKPRPAAAKPAKPAKVDAAQTLAGQRIVLWGYDKDSDAAKEITAAGGKIMTNVGKTTTMIVKDGKPLSSALKSSAAYKKLEELRAEGKEIELTTWSALKKSIKQG